MTVEELPWDSGFFGFSVGRIEVPCCGTGLAAELMSLVRDSSMGLIYVNVPVTLPEPECSAVRRVLAESSGTMYDRCVTFRKRIKASALEAPQGYVVAALRLSAHLEELAYASGVYSRFALDPRLASFFRPMYRLWLQKDLAKGKVFVWREAAAPQGMATVSVQDGIGKIGLVAVSAESRGRGIASYLMAAVDAWLLERGIDKCEVVTQGGNVAAQALYRKTGFSCCNEKDVWHVWRQEA